MGAAAPMHRLQRAALGSGRAVSTAGQERWRGWGHSPLVPSLLFGQGLFLILCFPQTPWNPGTDMWWHELMNGASTECEPEWCDAEDKLFILYTSGSTGKPKVRLACPAE